MLSNHALLLAKAKLKGFTYAEVEAYAGILTAKQKTDIVSALPSREEQGLTLLDQYVSKFDLHEWLDS